ncbi:MAG: SDR family oxidoreductase [Rubrivivax sp.]
MTSETMTSEVATTTFLRTDRSTARRYARKATDVANPFGRLDRRGSGGLPIMHSLEGRRVLVLGASRGLGLGVVEALAAKKAVVTAAARDAKRLEEVRSRFGVDVAAGDATDASFVRALLATSKPSAIVLTAGGIPAMAPIHEQKWEDFEAIWQNDVKSALVLVQEAIKLPLERGARVLLGSSGAAVNGSPWSGGYAGAKRMVWLMANYANGVSQEKNLGIKFQTLVPQQIIGDTELGRSAATAYAGARGITVEAFLANFGKPMPPRAFGDHVATILEDESRANVTAFGLKGDTGIVSLDPS